MAGGQFNTARRHHSHLYVAKETAHGFEVRELRGGKSKVRFDYRILARRRGFEAVRLADMTEQRKATQANTGLVSEAAVQLATPLQK
jgi:hypothetical protein